MVEIDAFIKINSPIDKVWEVISDIDNEPKFWKGTKEIRNLSKEGNTIKREITIAFRDQKCLQDVNLVPKEKIEAIFTKGIIVGKKLILLKSQGEKTEVNVKWDIKLGGMMSMFTVMIKKHIKSGTTQALENIKDHIENDN